MSKPHDLTAFRGGASYFDTPMGYIFPRLLCSFPKAKIVTTLSNGTNGWMSSWGTNAHGEIAGCPPPRR